jgi:hypothetical protein
MIPALLSIIIAFSFMAVALVETATNNLFLTNNSSQSEESLNIAEAGINYYMWHLNHNSSDYKDGQSTPNTPNAQLGYGPYVHNYVDSNNVTLGTYTLWINPAGNGSTIVTVTSIGKVNGSNNTTTVAAEIGSPSFASYAVASNTPLWFGSTESADGPVMSNVGIRMDGPSDDTVGSANTTYVPPDEYGGDGNTHPGVWCSTSVTSPVNCNTRSKTDWIYPDPQLDFNEVSNTLCTIKVEAFAANSSTSSLATAPNACNDIPSTLTSSYLPERSSSYSLTRGYLILLNNNGTYNLYDVNAENDQATPYTSALTTSLVGTNITIPASGVIYAEDNVWVLSNPTYNGRVTIAAGRLTASSSSSYANIVIAGPLVYATKNGTDSIGLISQESVIIAPYAPPASGAFTYEIDGALIAENGEAWYPGVYRTDSNKCTRGWTNSNQSLLFYGSVSSNQTWTWSWLDGGSPCGDASYDPANGYISGFDYDTSEYDYNLTYSPPPSYPLTSGYNILSWKQKITQP